ncbi:MAG: hypothetical protein CME61_07400 [Halobacteriovoraceae bacterium]|nr:hypothetical protein [Halobacteriovoraceae bacterium]
MDSNNFIEGKDFEVTKDGKVVMTASYLLKRGRCCSSGCQNCPYGYENSNPEVPQELQMEERREENTQSSDSFHESAQLNLSFYEKYLD